MRVKLLVVALLVLLALLGVSCGPDEIPVVPKVIGQNPPQSAEVTPRSPIIVEFNQPLDSKSVEGQVRIEPAVAGQWQVEDSRLVFEPSDAFQRATTYKVVVGAGVKSSSGVPLADEIVLRFQTVGYLQVAQVQPSDGATEVERTTNVVVVFNRPVVPLTDLKAATGLPQPLRLDPPVDGTGEWLNTSIYVFRPKDGLAGSTTYHATVAAGLEDTTGSLLPEDYTWTFSTESPKIVKYSPEGMKISPDTDVKVTFNQPMDAASVEQGFSLRRSRTGDAVAGSFSWDGETMRFQPASRLEFGAAYAVRIAAGVKSTTGGTLPEAAEWQFTVVPKPAVVGTTPTNGDQSAPPYGGVEIRFAGPMLLETITPTLRIEPEGTQWQAYWDEYSDRLYLSLRLEPATSYRVHIPATAADPYGNTLGEEFVLEFRTRNLDPTAYFMQRTGETLVFSAYNDVSVQVAYRNLNRITLSLYRLSLDEFIRLNGDDWEFRNKFRPSEASLVRSWTLAVSPPPNQIQAESVALAMEGGAPVGPGTYYVVLSTPATKLDQYQSSIPILVTRTNLTVKRGPEDLLVWATDLGSGQPVPSLRVDVYDAEGIALSGRTGADGVWKGQFSQAVDPWAAIMVVTGSGDSLAATSTRWSQGINAWDFSLSSEPWIQPYVGYFYTDRPIYRPGQTVYYKGIIRADDDARYSLPDIGEVKVTIMDPQGQEFYNTTLSVSDMGTVYGDLALADDAPVGLYQLSVSAPEVETTGKGGAYFGTTFQVAEYRKPEYEISVNTDGDDYVQGDQIQVEVSARYYFGAPVANAKVLWSVTAQPYFFQWQGKGRYDFHMWDYWEDFQRGPQVVAQGETTTDAAGNATFSVPADIQKFSISQVFSIEARVIDVSQREVAGRTATPVHKGEFYIGLSPQSYVGTVGKPQSVSVITVDPESQPVPNVPVTVVFALRKWYSVQERGADGRYYWKTQFTDTPVFTQTVTTGAEGAATAQFTPESGGSYRALATATDARGNEVQSATFLWITGRQDEYVPWRMENNNRIELIADKETYAPGETARVLIPSPFQGSVTTLLTVERAGVLSYRVITLQSNSEQVEIPITADHIPDVFVSAVLVKGKGTDTPYASFRVGYTQLVVSAAEKELSVRVTPQREGNFSPRETVRFTVETLDVSGRGVPAEVSLGLVDASVLALAQRPGPSIVDFFYRQRGLGVQTATNMTLAVTEREVEPPSDGKGGGGGDESSVREFFPDTAYWAPAVQTDAQGKAEVSVQLPDSLTTWRMLSEGVTTATQVGSSQTDLVVTKDLLVRPVLPRFFVIGDRAELAAVVHNNTDNALQVEITLAANGLSLEGGAHSVEIPAHGLQKVTWTATAGNVEQASVTFRAGGGGLEDAVALTLPVYHYSTPEVVATAGEVGAGEQRLEIVRLPDVYDPTQGSLTVQVDPSLAAGMEEGFRYLRHFPYECAEQTVSRFLPNVVTWRALREMGVRNEELEANLPDLVAEGLQKLYTSQNVDGGWGWWRREESDPGITAYVLLGLKEAQRAGFAVDENVTRRGVDFLRGRVKVSGLRTEADANEQAFILFVLAEYGAQDPGRAANLYDQRHLLGHFGKAFLGMALAQMGDAHASQVQVLVSELSGQAVLSATGAHWEEQVEGRRLMNTDVRSTAIVLRALVRLDPQNGLLANAVRWLMAAREQGRWGTTQENAWAIMGLTDYMVKTGELQGTYKFQVGLNGKRVLSDDVRPADVGETRSLDVPIADLLKDVGNRVLFERTPLDGTDTGSLYYSAYLKYYLPVEDVQPLVRGIVVAREYTLQGNPDAPISEAKVGDFIRVKLTLIAPSSLHYLVLEDPIPAGTEAVDTSLRTTSQGLESSEFQDVTEPDDVWGWWVFSHTEIRDEKVALFASRVNAGTYEYTYLLRASVPGEFLVMPAVAYEMYFPETFGRSAGGAFTVTSGE